MTLALITLFVALSISAVAAWYSILGLMAIFAASATSIAIMGGVLEVGKLVTASWLYQNWSKVPFLLKSYLTIAVVVLMFITSMGIFGYLSKAHIDQGIGAGDSQAQIERLDTRIERQEQTITRAQASLDQLDLALDRYIELGAVTKGLKAREEQEEERTRLDTQITQAENTIAKLNEEKADLSQTIREFEVEVGPIKYIAEFVYEDGRANLEEAVRWVIIILIFVFDPLAVLLVIAANISLKEQAQLKKPVKETTVASASEWDQPWKEEQADVEQPQEWYSEEDEKRMDIIGQNGNEGLHYEELEANTITPESKEWKDKYEEEARQWLGSNATYITQTYKDGDRTGTVKIKMKP